MRFDGEAMRFVAYVLQQVQRGGVGRQAQLARAVVQQQGLEAGLTRGALGDPDHRDVVDLEFRREWDFGNQESGNEEYRALITAYPDIRGATRFSNEVSANLG